LLSLLQTRRTWSGAELAHRLGVTDRALRRDIDRLRALDYPVHATTGTAGGYRLASGQNLPPLLLDDEEALATAIALATAAAAGTGTEDSALRALTKLQRVLPARLRPQLAALTGTTAAVAPRNAPGVDPDALAVIAAGCRDGRSSRSTTATGATSRRRGGWSRTGWSRTAAAGTLIAFDPSRDDWRTFRIDRMADLRPTRRAFAPRDLPAPDAATFLLRSFAHADYRHTARVSVGLSARRCAPGSTPRSPATSTRTLRTPARWRSRRSRWNWWCRSSRRSRNWARRWAVEQVVGGGGRRIRGAGRVAGGVLGSP
jgi:biotin operon repressor